MDSFLSNGRWSSQSGTRSGGVSRSRDVAFHAYLELILILNFERMHWTRNLDHHVISHFDRPNACMASSAIAVQYMCTNVRSWVYKLIHLNTLQNQNLSAMPGMNLCQYLSHTARINPSKVLTVCGERRCTSSVLAARVAALSNSLVLDFGVKEGDRIILAALNSDLYLEMVLAIFAAGAVVAPLNWRWSLQVMELKARQHVCFSHDLVPTFESNFAGCSSCHSAMQTLFAGCWSSMQPVRCAERKLSEHHWCHKPRWGCNSSPWQLIEYTVLYWALMSASFGVPRIYINLMLSECR